MLFHSISICSLNSKLILDCWKLFHLSSDLFKVIFQEEETLSLRLNNFFLCIVFKIITSVISHVTLFQDESTFMNFINLSSRKEHWSQKKCFPKITLFFQNTSTWLKIIRKAFKRFNGVFLQKSLPELLQTWGMFFLTFLLTIYFMDGNPEAVGGGGSVLLRSQSRTWFIQRIAS